MKLVQRTGERGSQVLEAGLVLVPMMLSIFAVCELGRAMWTYHTLASAVKTGTRYAALHGARCADASSNCPVTIAGVVSSIQENGIGLDSSKLQLTLTAGQQVVSCNPVSACSGNTTVWPPAPGNAVGLPLTINARYAFDFVLGILWPGQSAGTVTLAAKSNEIIEF
jgi:Flp pilus assembly protein TadG